MEQERPRACGFCRQPGHTIGYCNNERAHHHFESTMRSVNIIKNLPNTNNEEQAVRFRSFLSNNHSATQLKLLALRFFQYRGLQHNIVAHVTFIVDKLFDPEERRPFQEESQALEILRRISQQNIIRRNVIRNDRTIFDRETERYNALRNAYRERVNEYNRNLTENLGTEIETIRRHFTHIPNGANILAQMNASLEGSNSAAQRHSIVGYTMASIQNAIVERDRQIEEAERERIRRQGLPRISIICTESAHELQQPCECPICYGDEVRSIEMVETGCSHQFCAYCISRHIDQERPDNKKACCPLCRAEISNLVVKDLELSQELADKFN